MMDFKDKVVWVTGNVTGIGRVNTFAFANLGAKVIVHGYKNKEASDNMHKELIDNDFEAFQIEGDVTDKSQMEEAIEKIKNHFGRIDILVNNVGGLVKIGAIEEIDEEDWDHVIDLNLKSVYLITKLALPLMKNHGAKIVNFVSNVERYGGSPDNFAYTAAKGGVAALTRALAKQLYKYDILVNGVAPGLVDTPFHDIRKNRDSFKQHLDRIPMHRSGKPEEISNVVLFLASELSDFMMGEVVEASGGRKLS